MGNILKKVSCALGSGRGGMAAIGVILLAGGCSANNDSAAANGTGPAGPATANASSAPGALPDTLFGDASGPGGQTGQGSQAAGGAQQLTPATMQGRWSTPTTGCREAALYLSDGHFSGQDGQLNGTYSISGDSLTRNLPNGPTVTYRIARYDGNRIDLVQTSGSVPYTSAMARCPMVTSEQTAQVTADIAATATRMRTRLPVQNGSTTINEAVADHTRLILRARVSTPFGPDRSVQRYDREHASLTQNFCNGMFRSLIERGGEIHVRMSYADGYTGVYELGHCFS